MKRCWICIRNPLHPNVLDVWSQECVMGGNIRNRYETHTIDRSIICESYRIDWFEGMSIPLLQSQSWILQTSWMAWTRLWNLCIGHSQWTLTCMVSTTSKTNRWDSSCYWKPISSSHSKNPWSKDHDTRHAVTVGWAVHVIVAHTSKIEVGFRILLSNRRR